MGGEEEKQRAGGVVGRIKSRLAVCAKLKAGQSSVYRPGDLLIVVICRSPRWRIRLSSSLVYVGFVSSSPLECILV